MHAGPRPQIFDPTAHIGQFIERLAQQWPAIRLESYGTSAQGRSMPLVIVSRDAGLTAATHGDRASIGRLFPLFPRASYPSVGGKG